MFACLRASNSSRVRPSEGSFAEHLDPAILSATAERFGPALPFSFEGLAYAALGLLLGAGMAAGLSVGARHLGRSLRVAASRLSSR